MANAVSQSNNGSVTNQAIQMNQGNVITNHYGGGIICQGPQLAISPFSTFGVNYRKPFNHTYDTPVYDPTDLVGDFDDDGNPIGDGTPDNPGKILYYQQNYSGTNKDSYALNTGISLTFTIPLDRQLQKECKNAAKTQVAIQEQVLKNKQLDWNIARIKECGKLKQEGILIAKDSVFFNICKDVYLVPKANQVLPHTHEIKIK